MNKQNWKQSFFTIWAGQAVSLISSSVLQMAIILYILMKLYRCSEGTDTAVPVGQYR